MGAQSCDFVGFCVLQLIYRKFPKFSDIQKIGSNHSKFELCGFAIE